MNKQEYLTEVEPLRKQLNDLNMAQKVLISRIFDVERRYADKLGAKVVYEGKVFFAFDYEIIEDECFYRLCKPTLSGRMPKRRVHVGSASASRLSVHGH